MSFRTFLLVLVPLAFIGGWSQGGFLMALLSGFLYLGLYLFVILRD